LTVFVSAAKKQRSGVPANKIPVTKIVAASTMGKHDRVEIGGFPSISQRADLLKKRCTAWVLAFRVWDVQALGRGYQGRRFLKGTSLNRDF
jgi:hypothetical protein